MNTEMRGVVRGHSSEDGRAGARAGFCRALARSRATTNTNRAVCDWGVRGDAQGWDIAIRSRPCGRGAALVEPLSFAVLEPMSVPFLALMSAPLLEPTSAPLTARFVLFCSRSLGAPAPRPIHSDRVRFGMGLHLRSRSGAQGGHTSLAQGVPPAKVLVKPGRGYEAGGWPSLQGHG
jgi:hypothetical protein